MAAWRRVCSDTVVPVLLLIIVNLIFSGYVVYAKLALTSGTSPEVFALLRDLIACILFVPTLWLVERRKPPAARRFWPRQEHWGLIIALGVLGVFGAQLLGSISLSFLSSATYGLLSPATPVFTLLVSLAVGVDTVNVRAVGSWVKLLGVLVTVGGAVVIVYFSSSAGGTNQPIGFAFILCQKVMQGSYPVLQKWVLSRYDYPSLTLATWAYVTGTTVIAMIVLTTSTEAADWVLTPTSVGALFFSGVLSSFFNYGAMAYVNGKTSPLVTMAFYPLQSFGTPLLSSLFLGYTLKTTDAIGGAVVVLGLFALLWGRHLEGGAPATGVVALSDEAEVATIRLRLREVAALVAAAAKSSGLPPEELVEALLQRPPAAALSPSLLPLRVATAPSSSTAAAAAAASVGGSGGGGGGGGDGGGGGGSERTRLLLGKPRGGGGFGGFGGVATTTARSVGGGDGGGGSAAPASSSASAVTEHILGVLASALAQRGHAAAALGGGGGGGYSSAGGEELGSQRRRPGAEEDDDFFDAHQPARDDAAASALYRRASTALGGSSQRLGREASVVVEPPG